MFGNGLKNKLLNKKIIIYQMPLFERIIGVCSAIELTLLPIVCLLTGVEKVFETVICLLVMLIYDVSIFFSVFKTYICLDIDNRKLIIRESPGLKKQELSLDGLKEFEIFEDTKYNLFTLNINYVGYTKKIDSWSTHPSCRLAIFNVYKRQTKRLKKFCEKCNEYLIKA